MEEPNLSILLLLKLHQPPSVAWLVPCHGTLRIGHCMYEAGILLSPLDEDLQCLHGRHSIDTGVCWTLALFAPTRLLGSISDNNSSRLEPRISCHCTPTKGEEGRYQGWSARDDAPNRSWRRRNVGSIGRDCYWTYRCKHLACAATFCTWLICLSFSLATSY